MFGFVSRKPSGGNECHVLAEYDREQPATDIVDFVQKVVADEVRWEKLLPYLLSTAGACASTGLTGCHNRYWI